MFGRGTAESFAQLPSIQGLDADEARRALSTAYIDILSARAEAERRTGPERTAIIHYLRRLANTVESHVVFDGRQQGELRDGAAFVAAEALAFLAELIVPPTNEEATAVELAHRALQRSLSLVEAGLLYLIAGFETNAATLLVNDPAPLPRSASNQIDLVFMDWALESLVALCRLDTRFDGNSPPRDPRAMLENGLNSAVRAEMLRRLRVSVCAYLGWLRGESDEQFAQARVELTSIRRSLIGKLAYRHADIYHLVRLTEAAIVVTASRAVRSIPHPSFEASASYSRYLFSRARGSERSRARPVLWPAAQDYVQRCLPGPHRHAVVSVPTGAGKSFLAEVAVSHGIDTGWALYLVPTNALANQVRSELERAFIDLRGSQVRAFLGGDEYTTLGEEHASSVTRGTVVVMTPEKCALALRLAPESFTTCRVCVFDECHLLSDGTRGVLAELVISHVAALAPSCRFVLMSAMMANPQEVADWLTASTGVRAEVVRKPWRPTRTIRGVVGADLAQASEASSSAWTQLVQPPQSSGRRARVRMPFEVKHLVVANLQGTWTQTAPQEYAVIRFPTSTQIAVRRTPTGRRQLDLASWVNRTAGALTAFLATRKLSVLTFLPSNKHHCFSVADDVVLSGEAVAERRTHKLVEALLLIAEDELGVRSAVSDLIKRRISVHTSALLDSEKIASEVAFQDGISVAMFATGTLAQGLNLPASVVVIGGTAVGDRREANTPDGQRRTHAQLLNALGRAGRAGFSNQGVALVVTDHPLFFGETPDIEAARQDASFLALEDDSTEVDSRLLTFVQAALSGSLNVETASAEDLVALSYLPIEPVGSVDAEQILRRSYAVHRRGGAEGDAARAAAELVRVGRAYIQRVGAPDWITTIAYKTGLPFLLCLRIHQALQRVLHPGFGAERPSTRHQWRSALFRTLAYLPPTRAREVVGKEIKSELIGAIWNLTIRGDNPDWSPPDRWSSAWNALEEVVSLYMDGEQLAILARRLLAISPDDEVDHGRSTGDKPIPRAIGFVNNLLERLSRMAGVLVAIDESAPIMVDEGAVPPPESVRILAELPLTLRYGCSSRSELAWFRFGIRFRRPARLLAHLFPVPGDLTDDADVRNWVREQRRLWLQEHEDAIDLPGTGMDPVLKAARVVMTT